SRRTASLLAAAALIVPSTLGATTATAAHSSPLCSLTGCDESDGPATGSGPAATVSPDVPTKPTEEPPPSPTDAPSPSDEPTEEPTDPESPEPTSPGGLDTDEPSDEPPEETNGEFPEDAQRDENAPIFTEHPAAMGSESLSFEGLSGISFVSVPTADG